MVKSVPRQTSSFRGEILVRVGEAKEQGRRLPKVESDLRSWRMPCSGRTVVFVPHLGPPTAPRKMASALLAAERAVSVRAVECASIEDCSLC